jgi:hypothetical protein
MTSAMNHDLNTDAAAEEIARIIRSAERLGVEMDEAEAIQWLTAITAEREHDLHHDEDSGVFGHKISMLDFSPNQLGRFRELGTLVSLQGGNGIETALALSGSAAQSKIQSYPGDADFFERVNIHAESRAEACRVLAQLLREKALATQGGATYRLIEVKFGSYPRDVVHNGIFHRTGSPIAWRLSEIEKGQITAEDAAGKEVIIRWDEVASDPGWCKLDWLVIDEFRGQLANASNMLDVTWEAPGGAITPLDGYLDPYFQEVYLEADSIPLFTKLARHVSSDALDQYVSQLENEVEKYLVENPNYGKAAKRMYNVFRLTGRYYEAAFLRELFDEPATVLYQVWSLIRAIDDAVGHGSTLPIQHVKAQADDLILTVVQTLEGEEEQEIVRLLLRLRDALGDQERGHELSARAEAARAEVINVVNNFFHDRLDGLPEIRAYIEQFPRGRDNA